MERKTDKIKQGAMLITYAAILILLLVYCKDIIRGIVGIISLFKPFLMGIAFAFVLDQPYEWMRALYQGKLHMKEGAARKLAVLTAYLAVFAVIAAVIGVVIPQLANSVQMFAANISTYVDNWQTELNFFTDQLGMDAIDIHSIAGAVTSGIGEMDAISGTVLSTLVDATGTMVSFVANLFIALAFSVYLLAGKRRIISQTNRILVAYLPAHIYEHLRYLLKIIVQSFKNYIIGQSIEAVILGSLCGLGMVILRLDYAGMVSMVVGLTAMIPILGAYIGGAVAVILLFMVSPVKAGIFLIFFVVLQQVENNVIYPRVVGGRIGLPGIWVLLAITVGGKLGGVVGMLFGVPTMTVVYTLLKNGVRTKEREKNSVST